MAVAVVVVALPKTRIPVAQAGQAVAAKVVIAQLLVTELPIRVEAVVALVEEPPAPEALPPLAAAREAGEAKEVE